MKEKSAETGPHAEAIADELTRLCDELRIVNDTLAEIRQDIAWGIRNGRVVLSLADVSQDQHEADATVDGTLVELAIQLCMRLRAMRDDLTQVMEAGRPTPPEFSPGDDVVFELEGEEYVGEIMTIDAGGDALVHVPSHNEYVHVPPDLLSRHTPSAMANTVESPAEIEPENSDRELTAERLAAHERWCHTVRAPAVECSEGRRTIATAKDDARVEYEVAPLPDGTWAVNWQFGYFCGDQRGCSHPWTVQPSREDCIQHVLTTARTFFSNTEVGGPQQSARREMLKRLSGGLFGFIEPAPITDDAPMT